MDQFGVGPPKACDALYEGLKRSQEEEEGIDTPIWMTKMQLSCTFISRQNSINDIQEFVSSEFVVKETCER